MSHALNEPAPGMIRYRAEQEPLADAKVKQKPPGFFRQVGGYLAKVGTGTVSLFKGMGITLRYFVNPKSIVTEQYPENRATLKMHTSFRGEIVMPHDEQGEHRCTGCSLCEKACPNGTISVLNTKSLAGKKILGKYIYRIDQCTMCGLCIEACPHDAIQFGQGFEHADYDRSAFERILNRKEGKS